MKKINGLRTNASEPDPYDKVKDTWIGPVSMSHRERSVQYDEVHFVFKMRTSRDSVGSHSVESRTS